MQTESSRLERRALVTLVLGLASACIVGRSGPDPDLKLLRSDYMATWIPTPTASQMLYEYPAAGILSYPHGSRLVRSLSMLGRSNLIVAHQSAWEAAAQAGWTRRESGPVPDSRLFKNLSNGNRASFSAAYSDTNPLALEITLQIV